MVLITKEDVYQFLEQVTPSAPNDALLDTICSRVDSIISEYIGYTWDAYASVASVMTVTGSGTAWLYLPPHQPGSVTLVTLEGYTDAYTTLYAEQPDGSLYLTGVPPYSRFYGWPYQRFAVTAKWGYGAVPEALKEVAVELAVNLWLERQKGMFSDVIGVEGEGGVSIGYRRAWTNRQKVILDIYAHKFAQVTV